MRKFKNEVREEMLDAVSFGEVLIQDLLDITKDIIEDYSEVLDDEAASELEDAVELIKKAINKVNTADRLGA